MSYLVSIKTAFYVFPILSLFITIPFIIGQYHRYGSIHKFRTLLIYSFVLYLLTLYFLVILPLPSKSDVTFKPNMLQLTPFHFISDILQESSLVLNDPKTYIKALLDPCFYTVLFNLFMTIPFGMYLRYYFRCTFKKTLFYSFFLSLFFEVTQLTGLYFYYSYPYRVFDVDDLLINTLGGLLGYALMGLFLKFLPSRASIDQQSYKTGEIVSGLRRLTVFGLDMFFFLFFTLLGQVFFPGILSFLIIFILYYVIYPFWKNGRTLGSGFLNVRLVYDSYELIFSFLRICFLFGYYFVLPFGLISFFFVLFEFWHFESFYMLLLFLGIIFLLFVFYFVHILKILFHKKVFYDSWFKVQYQSTIKEIRTYPSR